MCPPGTYAAGVSGVGAVGGGACKCRLDAQGTDCAGVRRSSGRDSCSLCGASGRVQRCGAVCALLSCSCFDAKTPPPTALPAAPRAQPQSPRCLPCRPGTYAYTWGSSHCKHCIAGTYAPAARSSLCTMCPANWTSTEDGQVACAVRVTPAVDYRQRWVREGVGGSRGGGRERAACPTSSIAARSGPRPCSLPASPGRLRSRAAQPLGADYSHACQPPLTACAFDLPACHLAPYPCAGTRCWSPSASTWLGWTHRTCC